MFGAAGGPGFGINNYGGNSNGANDSLASGMDIAISPKLLTDFRLGYYRYNIIDTSMTRAPSSPTPWAFRASTSAQHHLRFAGLRHHQRAERRRRTPAARLWRRPEHQPLQLPADRARRPVPDREQLDRIIGNHTVKVGADLRYGRNLRVPSDSDRAGQIELQHRTNLESRPGDPGRSRLCDLRMLGDVHQLQPLRLHIHQRQGIPEAHVLLRAGHLARQHKLTLNLGLRWELYFPETVNGPGNGSLLNLTDGYLHVAGIGGIGSNLGWTIDKRKQFEPRIGAPTS